MPSPARRNVPAAWGEGASSQPKLRTTAAQAASGPEPARLRWSRRNSRRLTPQCGDEHNVSNHTASRELQLLPCMESHLVRTVCSEEPGKPRFMLAGAKGERCDGCHVCPVDFPRWKMQRMRQDGLETKRRCRTSSQRAAEVFFRGEIRSRQQQQA